MSLKAMLQGHTAVMWYEVVSSASYMRKKNTEFIVEKCLSSCLSYRLFATFLPKNSVCPRQQSQAAPTVE